MRAGYAGVRPRRNGHRQTDDPPLLTRGRVGREEDSDRCPSKPVPVLIRPVTTTDAAFQQCINPSCSGDVRRRRDPFRLPGLRRPHRRRLRLGPPARPRPARRVRGPVGRPARPPEFLRRLAVPRAPRLRSPRDDRHHRRRTDPAPDAPIRSAATSASNPAPCGSSTKG